MTSIWETYFVAKLTRQEFKGADWVWKYVTHNDLVFHGDYEVETAWMESHRQTLIREDLADLMRHGRVIPDADSLIQRARDDKLFADADI